MSFVSYNNLLMHFQIKELPISNAYVFNICKVEARGDQSPLDLSRMRLEPMDDRSRLQVLDLLKAGYDSSWMMIGSA